MKTPLDALDFMLGDWEIAGRVHGEPVRGTATVRRGMGGAWLEYRERLDGYEDLCLYGVDPDTGDLCVHHFADDGYSWHFVLPMDDGQGWHWVPTALGPVVRLVPEDGGWRTVVAHREAEGAEVELSYRRP